MHDSATDDPVGCVSCNGETRINARLQTLAGRGAVCALVAACDFNEDDFTARWRAGRFDGVVAVDAGFVHLERVGCTPDAVVGDFDSLGYVPEGANVERHPVRKDRSDLELALDRTQAAGFASVVVYGALGGRLDHTVAALQVCARFAEGGMGMTLVGPSEQVSILAGPASLELAAADAGTVSVFSAAGTARGVTERGLSYALEDAELGNRTALGLSNERTGAPASISVEEGTLYVFQSLG